MQARTLGAALMAVLLFAWPAAAQEQRASIEGVVKDSTGAILPGATVTAKGPALPAGTTTVSNEQGQFRFPGLPPGVYDVTAELSGFTAGKAEAVEVRLGQIKRVELTLAISGVTESVQVTAESPLIDVKQNAAFANINKELIDKLPKGRDFTSIVTIAPGANQETKLGGISIDGASGAENVYVIDGINTTSVRTGQSAKGLITDFVEEVQVKSSGYNAEFGGSMGGVINVISKSGSNEFRGDAGFYYSGNNLDGDVRPTLRLNPQQDTIAEYVTYPDDDLSRWEPGGTLGGPLFMNKAWFFAGYMPSFRTWERTAPYSNGTVDTRTRKDRTQNFTANANAQFSNSLRGKFAVNIDNAKRTGLLHNQDGTSSATALFDIDQARRPPPAAPSRRPGSHIRANSITCRTRGSTSPHGLATSGTIPTTTGCRTRRAGYTSSLRSTSPVFRAIFSGRRDSRTSRRTPPLITTCTRGSASTSTRPTTQISRVSTPSRVASRSIATATTCSPANRSRVYS